MAREIDIFGVWGEIHRARQQAHEKHGDNSIEALPSDSPRWLSVLVEEVGEVAHELTYDSAGSLRAELIDVLAVATAWVYAIDRDHPEVRSGDAA